MANWTSLIGLQLNDDELKHQLEGAGIDLYGNANIVERKNTKTFNYLDRGLSLYFIDERLDSIDFYNKSTKKFASIPSDANLPYGIEPKFTGKDFVMKFGEPVEKGGGSKSGIDIWLRFEHFQVELDERISWDNASNAIWNSLTIF